MAWSIPFDWSENFDNETGEEKFNLSCPNTEHHDQYGRGWETEYGATVDQNGEECDAYEGCPCCEDDSGYMAPMMNYIYPLDYQGLVTEEIQIELAQTNCIIVQENSTGDYYLTLTGGGMDLSPSIAWAFYKSQKWLPADFLQELKVGWCKDSLSKEKFEELQKVMAEQCKMEASRFQEKFKSWSKPYDKISQTSD